jgi:hypothetical protein
MKNLLCILFFPFLLVSCQDKKPVPDAIPKFEWEADISAPTGYEVSAMATYIFGNNHSHSFSVDKPYIYSGWGLGGGVIPVRGITKIPTKIQTNWLSKAEGKYYKASVKIDTVKIKQLIAKGCGIDEYTKEPIQYSSIVAGVAPGGVSAAWIESQNSIEMVGWVQGEEDPNPPMISHLDYRNIVKKYGKAPFYSGIYDDGVYKGVSYWMQPENIDFATKHGISYGSWDYYPKKYDWQPVLLSNKEYEIDNGYSILIHPVTGGREYNSMIKEDNTKIGPTTAPINWEEVYKFNYFKKQRALPSYIELSYYSNKDLDKGTLAKLMLPLKVLYDYFEKGYIKKDGTKGNYSKIVFEVNNKKNIVIWLLGNDNHKVKIGEYQGYEDNRINF